MYRATAILITNHAQEVLGRFPDGPEAWLESACDDCTSSSSGGSESLVSSRSMEMGLSKHQSLSEPYVSSPCFASLYASDSNQRSKASSAMPGPRRCASVWARLVRERAVNVDELLGVGAIWVFDRV